MSKTNRVVKVTLHGGGRSAAVPSLGAIIVGVPSTQIPEGYVQKEGFTQHFLITKYQMKPKLRLIPAEDPDTKILLCLKDQEKGVDPQSLTPTAEDEMLNYVFDWAIEQHYSISFAPEAKATRNDFMFRFEQRGFTRDKKDKQLVFGLTKL